ncbi:hypothetical protein SB772_43670, partial [Paraburkholderia sp. SIMBA_030]
RGQHARHTPHPVAVAAAPPHRTRNLTLGAVAGAVAGVALFGALLSASLPAVVIAAGVGAWIGARIGAGWHRASEHEERVHHEMR